MKKISIVMFLLMLFVLPYPISAQPNVECPNVKQLEKTSLKDKDELVDALEEIVPDTYGAGDYGNFYSEWEVITAQPFLETVGQEKEEVYYEMAKNFCGEAVADQSWLVRLYFPRWEGKSASALEGQIFLAKSDETDGWFVWFRYH
ncbi:hypothetical protein [Ornithinibacillus caprae]|nr:hypothetical protein [Ornithinibacillus caprae]